MEKCNEIIVIYYKNENNVIPANGPGAVVYNICKEWKENGILFKEMPIKSNKLLDIIRLVLMIGVSTDKIVNVHQSGNKIPYIIYLISKVNRRNKYYFTTHGCEFLQERANKNKRRKIRNYIEKSLLKKFENVVFVSKMYMNDIKQELILEGNVYYINNGYTPSKNTSYSCNKEDQLSNKKIEFLLSGGINRNKGVFDSLKLIKFLKENIKNKNIILRIIGSYLNQDMEEYNLFIKENELEDNIMYYGMISDKEEVYSFYKKADFVLSLSHYDTFNVSVVEALSVGTPVIVSSTTGAKEFVTNYKNGLVIDISKNYYDNILKYMELHNKDVKKQCIDSVINISWKKTAEEYLNLLLGKEAFIREGINDEKSYC